MYSKQLIYKKIWIPYLRWLASESWNNSRLLYATCRSVQFVSTPTLQHVCRASSVPAMAHTRKPWEPNENAIRNALKGVQADRIPTSDIRHPCCLSNIHGEEDFYIDVLSESCPTTFTSFFSRPACACKIQQEKSLLKAENGFLT